MVILINLILGVFALLLIALAVLFITLCIGAILEIIKRWKQ